MEHKVISIPISDLHLDPNNPRLPQKGMGERDIMRELFDKEKVIEVIESICRRGYLPNESLLVVKESGKNVVVEGNRRLCALKLLKQPSLIPEREKEVKAIGNPRIGEEVPIIVMSREEAKEIILYRHTTNPVRKWDLINQAKFYRALIDDGETVEGVVDKYGEKRSNVENFLKLEQLHYLAERMPLDVNTIAVVKDSKKFSLSTLDRIAKTPQFDELLGISFDENVRVKGSIPKSEFVKGYKKIVSDIANKEVDTRNLNTTDQIRGYLSGFGPSEKPDINKKGEFIASDFTLSSGTRKPDPKKPRKKRVLQCIIPNDVEFALKNRSLEGLFDELQKMSFKSYPNSVALSFRGFLEMSIYEYLKEKDLIKELEQKKNEGQMIGLKMLLNYLCEYPEKCGITKNVKNAVEKAANSGADKIFSVHSLNGAAHNPQLFMTPSELDSIGRHFEELIRIIVKGGGND